MAFEGNHQFDPALFIDGGQFPGQATYVTMPDGSEQLVHQVQRGDLDPDLNPELFGRETGEPHWPLGTFIAYTQAPTLELTPFLAILVEDEPRPLTARIGSLLNRA